MSTRTPTPTVGAICHYVSYGTPNGEYTSQCRAAIITEVIEKDDDGFSLHDVVHLAVLNPTGMFFNGPCFRDDGLDGSYRGGSWHWPERVDD